jgi:hypothetical protein
LGFTKWMIKHSVHFCHQSIYTPISVSHGGGGYGCVQQFPEQAMTKHQLPSPFPLSPLAQTESMHTTKSASYRQNTNLLSNLWSLICLPAERRMPTFRSLESICVYLRSGEWRAVFQRNWQWCLAFPTDLSERRQQNEVRRSKCALEWHCRALPRSILRSKKFVFGVFATASWRWWK